MLHFLCFLIIFRFKMNSKWNVILEIYRREYGYSDRYENYAHNSSAFNKSFLGSTYLMQHIKETHIVGEKYDNPRCLNFNRKGNLLCIGYDDNKIGIYDWAHNKQKYNFNSNHSKEPFDVMFIDTNDNSLEVISTSNDRQIRLARISPTGEVTSIRLIQFARGRPKLTAVPRSPNEFVGVNTVGSIFQMDLRCNKVKCSTDVVVLNAKGDSLPLYDIAHHPFAEEICIGGCDAFLRIYDKRNFKESVQKIFPKNMENAMEILYCIYNYNGNEILINYAGDGAYLFNSRNYNPGDYLASYGTDSNGFDDVCLLGPKSEFVIGAQDDGILFFKKISGNIVKYETMKRDIVGDTSFYICGVQPHPFLPVIASKTCKRGVVIWAPTTKYL